MTQLQPWKSSGREEPLEVDNQVTPCRIASAWVAPGAVVLDSDFHSFSTTAEPTAKGAGGSEGESPFST